MRTILALLALAVSLPLQAQSVSINGLRLWSAPDHTRLVFDTSAPVQHSIFSLNDPHRLVIDLEGARLRSALPQPEAGDRMVSGLRSAPRDADDLRVVLDLKSRVRPQSFLLKPNREYGHRLVVDLHQGTPKDGRNGRPQPKRDLANDARDVVIAIDAGHGGEDPGARGRNGTSEKVVVLAIARQLEALVKREPGMKPVMIRDGDYYLGLRQRMEKARSQRADIFISIHADAFRDSRVKGSSVYILSQRGASSEAARWLAESENSADLIGGVTLEDKDDVLASVLLDLSQTATMQASMEAADQVLSNLKRVGKTHKKQVQQAGFVVLKSPDTPSMLVETAFISNPAEERRLKDPRHQRKIARALMKGIRGYFRQHPPAGTWLAKNSPRKHVISRGDTLSGIAARYHISLSDLRVVNQIKGDRIRVGQVLTIPES